jgi:squalene synthase HpnC
MTLEQQSSSGTPESVIRGLQVTHDPVEAQTTARRLTESHYENFPVVSRLLPKTLRQDFCNIYMFCRVADDLADDSPSREQATAALEWFKQCIVEMYEGQCRTVVFTALSSTVKRHDIPRQPFLDLIDAFQQDQRINRYQTFEQLVDYCRRSANPVGRLVLYMCGYRDERRQLLSDHTCTALQLTNFWQDVRRDILDRDRIYLPRESMDQFGVTEEQIRQGRCDDNYRRLIRFEVDRCQAMFDEGRPLLALLRPQVRRHIALYGQGGEAILQAIRRQNYDTLSKRPRLSSWQKARLIGTALAAKFLSAFGSGRSHEVES